LIAFSLGNKPASVDDLALNYPPDNLVNPMLLSMRNDNTLSVEMIITPNEMDSWRISDNTLELMLYDCDAVTMFSPELVWLEQEIGYRIEDKKVIVIFEMDNLPPIFRVIRKADGYRIEWSQVGLAGKRIAIDPGHGGHDPGAVGYQIGLLEKDITLAISLELKALLEESGAEVFMTRSTDTLVDTTVKPGQHIRNDLWMRRNIVNDWSPDFFISVHNNSWKNGSAGGIETYYNRYSLSAPHSRLAAQLVQNRLVTEIKQRDRGVKYKESSDAVLHNDNFPSILAEILFISNRVEEKLMAEPGFAKRTAEAIFLGISDFFDNYGGENR